MMYTVFWLVVAAVMIVIELISLGLTTIWFAGGALIAAVIAYFGVSLSWQIGLFIVISILLLVVTRPIAAKHFMKQNEKTNVESFVGQKGIVIETIDNNNSAGRVKFNGVEWSARSVDDSVIQAGKQVVINDIKGVKLIVNVVE